MALVSTIYPPEVWAMESLMVLRDNLLMAGLVHRNFENEMKGVGDTVRTRKPTKLTVQDFAAQTGTNADLTNMTVQNLNAREVTVVLDKHKYTSFVVEDRDAATSIKDLREEFIIPAIDPVSQQIDDDVMTEYLTGTDYAGSTVAVVAETAVGGGNALDEGDIIKARETLNTQQCPPGPRVMVMSTEHEADALSRSLFHQANTAGTTQALREGNLGRAFGFETFMSQNVPTGNTTDTSGDPQSFAFHKNVMALVMRTMSSPGQGVGAVGSIQTIDNVAIRMSTSWQHTALAHVMSFDVLYGVNLLDANLGVVVAP